jgi:membrane-associated PAP2 superfamily phosphatase
MDQYHYSAERWLNDKSGEQGSVIDGRCDNLFDGWRLAMSSFDKMLGWFPHTATEWIELIIVAVLQWLLMVMAISELDLSSVIMRRPRYDC